MKLAQLSTYAVLEARRRGIPALLIAAPARHRPASFLDLIDILVASVGNCFTGALAKAIAAGAGLGDACIAGATAAAAHVAKQHA